MSSPSWWAATVPDHRDVPIENGPAKRHFGFGDWR
jgi:hypothetical protein